MNVEEHLEIIGRRLDTLIQIHIDRDREYHERFLQIEAQMARTDERMARTDERMAQVMEAINRLYNIVQSHEQRLDDLENQ